MEVLLTEFLRGEHGSPSAFRGHTRDRLTRCNCGISSTQPVSGVPPKGRWGSMLSPEELGQKHFHRNALITLPQQPSPVSC